MPACSLSGIYPDPDLKRYLLGRAFVELLTNSMILFSALRNSLRSSLGNAFKIESLVDSTAGCAVFRAFSPLAVRRTAYIRAS